MSSRLSQLSDRHPEADPLVCDRPDWLVLTCRLSKNKLAIGGAGAIQDERLWWPDIRAALVIEGGRQLRIGREIGLSARAPGRLLERHHTGAAEPEIS